MGNPACREQVQVLNYIHQKYDSVKIIGIPIFTMLDVIKRAIIVAGAHKKDSPAIFTEVVDLSDGEPEMFKLIRGYEITDAPTTIIVDSKGNTRHKLEGPHSLDEIEALLKELGVAQQEKTR